ncbi:hypothetical protein [Dictyobacter kobayashii]|uniref:DUF4037 domain-containing protein n=1 Tax=Dictyobacter kobayashii TaxID=2014872 RepID=A0A402AT32_9CHLR|nr:hypothetical protein [Dictyobacter kobayashii]GCE22239.1 hypothetical protein KDK_60390 [Dictyobacter kobayashii]
MTHLFPETAQFIHSLQKNENVLGILLVGSKSQGHDDSDSDDDLEVVVTETLHNLVPRIEQYHDPVTHKLRYDIRYTTLSALKQKVVSPLDTEHWPYEHASVLYDAQDGLIRDLCTAVAEMDASFRTLRIRYAAVSTTVAIGKACKALQRGYKTSSQLVVSRGAIMLARLLFALEWRWKPTDHWLEPELLTLKDPAQASLLLLEAVRSSSPYALREAMNRLENTFLQEVPNREERAHLYGQIMHFSHASQREIHTLF